MTDPTQKTETGFCSCRRCQSERAGPGGLSRFMAICALCGSKRCEQAEDHRNTCACEPELSPEPAQDTAALIELLRKNANFYVKACEAVPGAEWNSTGPISDAEHLANYKSTLEKTRQHFTEMPEEVEMHFISLPSLGGPTGALVGTSPTASERACSLTGIINAAQTMGAHLDQAADEITRLSAENEKLRGQVEDCFGVAQSAARQVLIDLAHDATNTIERKAYFRAETFVSNAIGNVTPTREPEKETRS